MRASVSRLEYTGTANAVSVEESFARAGVDDTGIRWIEGQARDSDVREKVIKRKPCRTAVSCFPDAPSNSCRVHHIRSDGIDDQCARAATDVAWSQRLPGTERSDRKSV